MLLESLATTALEKAATSGIQYLNRAKDEVNRTSKHNVASCVSYLEAARTAVLGLEDEVDEILIEAGLVARYQWESRSELSKRINSYLNRERLRPILAGALEGVSACYSFATQDVDGFFQRKARKEQKSEAVNTLLQLLGSLSEYLKSLSNTMAYDKVNYAGGSGIGLPELLTLETCLDDFQPGAKDAESRKRDIRELVKSAQERRQRFGLPIAADTKKAIQQLTVAFQLESKDQVAQTP